MGALQLLLQSVLGLREYYYFFLPTMDPSTAPVSAKELSDSHPGTLSRLDRADLVELIGNVM